MYRLFARPLLFRLDPERAHRLVLAILEWVGSQGELREALGKLFGYQDPRLEQKLFGLRFRNPVGLAAGFDKDARAARGLATLGFGFLELGSVSARPSSGNPRPRIFRLEEDKAIINRMGIPSQGADRVAERLIKLGAQSLPLGINLHFTTQVQLSREETIQDYRESFRRLYPCAGYFAVNLSCPNLPQLEFDPAGPEFLEKILQGLTEERAKLGEGPKPILVKLSPDLGEKGLARLLGAVQAYADGVIAVNTTASRVDLRTENRDLIPEEGGLSGQPLRARATEIVAQVYRQTEGKLPIIGVGGIFTAEDAWERIRAGASLVQIYTGLIYEGPGMVKRINWGLVRLLEEHGHQNIAEATGVAA